MLILRYSIPASSNSVQPTPSIISALALAPIRTYNEQILSVKGTGLGDDFTSYVMDCLAAARAGPVTRERLFGGSGLRIDGELFGVILRGTLYFVVDDQTRPRFVAAGMGPFTYSRKSEQRRIERWYELPEDVLLDPSELRDWVRDALAASRRTAKPEKTPAKRKSSAAAKTGPAGKKAAKSRDAGTAGKKAAGRKKVRPAR
jgi:TfoX/Sxy family transcriptional regulator of competence genes